MSASDPASASTSSAAPGPSGDAPAAPARRLPGSGRSLAGLALVLALVALIGMGYGAWRLWQIERGGHADTATLHDVQDKVQSLQSRLDTLASQRQALEGQVRQALQQSQVLSSQVQSLSERSRSLENAVASLTARAASGHDAMRLDEAEMLLRMANERFRLFHDGAGALGAYAMADRVMGEVGDPAYASVRQSIARERQALEATQPGRRQNDLDRLAQMRADVASWPLKPLDTPGKTSGQGFWQRVQHAFSGLVRIRRSTDDVSLHQRDLARSLTALDLAQAEAALLDWNDAGFQAALQRARSRIERNFDGHAAPVQAALSQIRDWLARAPVSAPELGDALHELRDIRAVHQAASPTALPSVPKARGKGSRR